MNASFDVVIVGGGVTGAAVGYGLAKRGVKTCLVDAVPTFSRASRANMGLIWCQSKALGCPQFVRWGFASSRAYGQLAAALKELSGIDKPSLRRAPSSSKSSGLKPKTARTRPPCFPARNLKACCPRSPSARKFPEGSGPTWTATSIPCT